MDSPGPVPIRRLLGCSAVVASSHPASRPTQSSGKGFPTVKSGTAVGRQRVLREMTPGQGRGRSQKECVQGGLSLFRPMTARSSACGACLDRSPEPTCQTPSIRRRAKAAVRGAVPVSSANDHHPGLGQWPQRWSPPRLSARLHHTLCIRSRQHGTHV